MDAAVRLEHELLAVETEQDVHVLLELRVPERDEDEERAPLGVALALDRSGSMHGRKLDTVKRAARFLTERLAADDRLAVVAYGSEVELVSPLGPPDAADVGPRIDAIGVGGTTNLSGGWLKALEEVERLDGGVRRVLLLTDGLANQGITEPDRLAGIARQAAERGVATTTIGVGDGYAEQVLTGVADAGGGGAWYAGTADDVPGIFAEEFEDLVAVAAQNVSVEVRPTGDVTVVGVLNDHPSVPVDGGVQVAVGDAYGGQVLRVVLALRVPALATLGAARVADVVLRYVTVGEEVAAHTTTLPVVVNAVSAEDAAAAAGDPEVADEVVVLLAARAADEARRLADAGDAAGASELLRDTARRLRGVAGRSDAGAALLRSAEVFERSSELASEELWSAEHRKRAHHTSNDLKRGRHRRSRRGEDG